MNARFWGVSMLLLGDVLLFGISTVADETVDYAKQVKPILQARCFACHGVLKQEAKLRLDTAAAMKTGGESGAGIQTGDATASLLVQKVSATDEAERMPPEGEPLTPAQITLLTNWIKQGAIAPADEQPERDPRDHWSFKTPVRPPVPKINFAIENQKSKIENPIDSFLAVEHQKRGLTPQPPADKRILLRRVYLDLIGLPPTREEQVAFLADHSADAYERVVNRLLDSQQYGERWGRHWMDLWRYSDWWGLGAEVRNSQKHIWHWRDWIIESLNADTGYDEMLREMLAADELSPNDFGRLRASGFLARQYFKFNRTTWLDETIEHTAKAFLGLTFNCAKCHDHKYDPFAQVDYYRFRAFFEPYQIRTDQLPGEVDFEKNGLPRAFDCNLDAATFLHIRGDDRRPDKDRVIESNVPAFLSLGEFKIEAVALPSEAHQPGLRPFVLDNHLKAADRAIADARQSVEKAKQELTKTEASKRSSHAPREEQPKTSSTSNAKSNVDAQTADVTRSVTATLKDDFKAERPEVWEARSGKWKHADGKLIQSESGTERATFRLKKPVSENFEVKLKFTTTGGQMWKSVGIAFDVVGEDQELLAYMSAVAGGSKLQIAFKNGSRAYSYPPEAGLAREVKLDTPYELTLRARGTLLNVLIDGKLALAYRLPIARKAGALDLITYDATAEFTSFELSELPANVKLTEAGNAKPSDALPSLEQAKAAVVLAEKTLAAAEAEPESIRTRAAADRLLFARPAVEEDILKAGLQQAARAEKVVAAAKADVELARAELELTKTVGDKKAEAEKKVAAARSAFEAATKIIESPGESYTSLRGALKTLESNLETEASRSKPFPATSTGRRTALARWMTDVRHPLTARVAVNHIWSRHFGRPLVPTVFDFGRKGTPPTHPELLDWLAVEFMEHGWSMKHVHRLMVTSAAYRMSSSQISNLKSQISDSKSADPDNRFYWRMNSGRMEAQVIRDSLLFLAGELDLKFGGPSIPVTDEASRRRSLYFVHSKNDHQKFLEIFDDASVLDCYRRSESIVPQQALALENSPLATTMSAKIAQQIAANLPDASDEAFIQSAFVTILASEPSPDELDACRQTMSDLRAISKFKNQPDIDGRVRVHLVQSLLNHNDFVTVR